MSGAWGLALQVLLPIPTVLLILLSIPTPRTFKRALLRFADVVLSIKIFSTVKLGHFFLMCAGLAFATSTYKTFQGHRAYDVNVKEGLTPAAKLGLLATKWRLERNFWIAAMCFTMWVILNRFYQMALHSVQLQERINELEYERAQRGPSSAAARLPSAPPAPADVEMKAASSGSSAKQPAVKKVD